MGGFRIASGMSVLAIICFCKPVLGSFPRKALLRSGIKRLFGIPALPMVNW
jgi:hypothetical protein